MVNLFKESDLVKMSAIMSCVGISIMKSNMTLRNSLANKMKMNINMLGASMKSRIRRKTNSTLVTTESEGTLEGMEIIDEISKRNF